jgi:hypothetical protein
MDRRQGPSPLPSTSRRARKAHTMSRSAPRLLLTTSLSLTIAALLAPSAQAAKPCGSERVADGAHARVAVVGVDCAKGLEVAADVYRRIAAGEAPQRRDHYLSGGFSCSAVLASTELSCKQRSHWILASTQPTDHPSQWHIPHRPARHLRHTYWHWRHCAPPPAVISADMLTHRVSCRRGRKMISRILVKSQTVQTSHLRALGFTCRLRPYATRAITCHRGGKRVLSPLAG